MLAGDQSIEEDFFMVDIPFDGQILEAGATFSSGDFGLIGTQLIREYCLSIDFAAKILRLERSIDFLGATSEGPIGNQG